MARKFKLTAKQFQKQVQNVKATKEKQRLTKQIANDIERMQLPKPQINKSKSKSKYKSTFQKRIFYSKKDLRKKEWEMFFNIYHRIEEEGDINAIYGTKKKKGSPIVARLIYKKLIENRNNNYSMEDLLNDVNKELDKIYEKNMSQAQQIMKNENEGLRIKGNNDNGSFKYPKR